MLHAAGDLELFVNNPVVQMDNTHHKTTFLVKNNECALDYSCTYLLNLSATTRRTEEKGKGDAYVVDVERGNLHFFKFCSLFFFA